MKPSDILSILSHELVIWSSGSTGESKPYIQPTEKVYAASKVAIEVQGLTKDSKIYTVMKLDHAGGLLGQTIPGAIVGASNDLEPFNAYEWIKKINNYTHSHITPAHALAIMKTKGFWNLNLNGITITCGSEPVTWNIIEAFVGLGCKFIVNWGMSEIGPIAISHTFESMEEVRRVKSICPIQATLMGSNKYCDYKIEDGELVVKGDICIYDDWYHTKDKVVEIDGILFYLGRTNKEVDFEHPVKGL
jgi:acyl-coenzyme A synthetase/AMP-(fatty) acid ligase